MIHSGINRLRISYTAEFRSCRNKVYIIANSEVNVAMIKMYASLKYTFLSKRLNEAGAQREPGGGVPATAWRKNCTDKKYLQTQHKIFTVCNKKTNDPFCPTVI